MILFPLDFWDGLENRIVPVLLDLCFLLQEKKLLLEKNGPHVARISVFEVCSKRPFDPFFKFALPSNTLACLVYISDAFWEQGILKYVFTKRKEKLLYKILQTKIVKLTTSLQLLKLNVASNFSIFCFLCRPTNYPAILLLDTVRLICLNF